MNVDKDSGKTIVAIAVLVLAILIIIFVWLVVKNINKGDLDGVVNTIGSSFNKEEDEEDENRLCLKEDIKAFDRITIDLFKLCSAKNDNIGLYINPMNQTLLEEIEFYSFEDVEKGKQVKLEKLVWESPRITNGQSFYLTEQNKSVRLYIEDYNLYVHSPDLDDDLILFAFDDIDYVINVDTYSLETGNLYIMTKNKEIYFMEINNDVYSENEIYFLDFKTKVLSNQSINNFYLYDYTKYPNGKLIASDNDRNVIYID